MQRGLRHWSIALFLLISHAACRSTPSADANSVAAIRATIDDLYAAFCFDANAEPDWDTQRPIYLDGASFVRPASPDTAPVADDLEAFLSTFHRWATEGEHASTGFHERIVGVHIEAFGGIAHAFVAFEGFRPGTAMAATRGLDSLQLVRHGDLWQLASFATQYEAEDSPLPTRFLKQDGMTSGNRPRGGVAD